MSTIYDTPKSDLNEESNDFKLFKSSGVGVATFFGTPIAGGIVMALNYRRLGLFSESKKAIIFSTLGTFVFLFIVTLIPENINIPNAAFTVPQLIVMMQLAKAYQQKYIDEHLEKGGKLSSNWVAFGIGLLVLIPILGLSLGLIYLAT